MWPLSVTQVVLAYSLILASLVAGCSNPSLGDNGASSPPDETAMQPISSLTPVEATPEPKPPSDLLPSQPGEAEQVSQPSSPLALLPTPTPAPTLPAPIPTAGGVVIHQGVGRDSFEWLPIPFEISYDPAIWRYVEEDPYRPRVLLHRLDEQCYLWPECCAIGADPIGPVELAGYTWTLYDSGDGIIYALWRGEEFYLFGIPVLQSGPLADGQCRSEAEKVIDTFLILEGEPEQTPVK